MILDSPFSADSPSVQPGLTPNKPVALSFAAHDPTVGAGLSADLAVFAALGCQPSGVLTGLTAQDTQGVKWFEPLSPEQVISQAQILMADMPPRAVKTGALCNEGVVHAIVQVLQAFDDIPLVVDPVMASGRGDALASVGLRAALIGSLLPIACVVTPNLPEALALSGQRTAADAAGWFLDLGVQAVLLTGTHDPTTGADVVNTLYTRADPPVSHRCLRLPGTYHGSGCTLASALAGFLAQGLALAHATHLALRFTWETLAKATLPGQGQAIPDRLLGRYWSAEHFQADNER